MKFAIGSFDFGFANRPGFWLLQVGFIQVWQWRKN